MSTTRRASCVPLTPTTSIAASLSRNDIDATTGDAHPAATAFELLGADDVAEGAAAELVEPALLVEVATPSAPLPQPTSTARRPTTPTATP
ncbi:hypothetical protein GCM10007298_07370 [Williamsia phyllosphaerae]|uniref:Uncharacterized protein n=1 Tax=Williamsia phyllosphaerae TaxID=885042 RepID=A0ABQ1UDB8_9NOCA|nr:hypothetical protein GCM10007298_07370 [Williamsia phyllosphaerae]